MRSVQTIITTLIIFILSIGMSGSNQAAGAKNQAPVISATSAVLMDAASGRVLYKKDCHRRLPQASLTKIMTALLVVENGDLDKKVTISENAAGTPECSIYLEAGETLTREELLYGAMLNSGNDAAVALAESIAGDEKDFVALMNKRVQELGLDDTHFLNPHGLQTAGHYSSAYDLALLSRKAMAEPAFAEVVKTTYKTIPREGHEEDRKLFNMNRLLYRYEGSIGVKTGYTKEAGNCVVGAARKGDMTLIAVSMNSTTVYDDLQRMLDYGFEKFQLVSLDENGDASIQVAVSNGESRTVAAVPSLDLKAAVTPEEMPNLRFETVPVTELHAPVKEGSIVGVCNLYINDEQVGAIDLLAAESVNEKSPGGYMQAARHLLNTWYLYAFVLFLVMLAYKRIKKITWEECLRRLLRATVGSVIMWQRRRKLKKLKTLPRRYRYYRNDL